MEDRDQVDLLIIIGTSLKVAPVSDTICKLQKRFEHRTTHPSNASAHLPHSVPQILINKTPIRHINPDVSPCDYWVLTIVTDMSQIVLLGNADEIVMHLCRRLGWDLPDAPVPMSNQLEAPRRNLKKRPSAEFEIEPRRVGNR